MGKEEVVGTWRLVSAEYRGEDGEVTYPFGVDAVGLLIYLATGDMAVQLMRTDLPALAAPGAAPSPPHAPQGASQGYLAYFGTYTVDETTALITHQIHGHLWPHLRGATITRSFVFVGPCLRLSWPVPRGDGKPCTAWILWERAV